MHEAILLVPGDPQQLTGGYVYDRHMVAGLRRHGWDILLQGLPGRFPDCDDTARRGADTCLAALADNHLVIIDGLALGGLPDIAARHGARLRLVALIHHPLADETGLSATRRDTLDASEREALRHVRHVLVNSPFTASRMRDYGVPAHRIAIVPPGTDPAPLAAGSANGSLRLLCVGSVIPRKGHDILIRALATLDTLPWHLDCVGSLAYSPDYANTMQELTGSLQLEKQVHFHGEHPPERLADYWHASDAFVLPSHYEGYGMVFAEALARGLPIIATRGGAIPSTVPDGAGLLSEPGDVEGLADNLRSFMTEPRIQAGLRTRAIEAGQALPDWEAAGDRFARTLEDIQGGHP
ncbi:MAG: glycosyltransferase family 4 protein [Aquisalimonadaceae bacterium]